MKKLFLFLTTLAILAAVLAIFIVIGGLRLDSAAKENRVYSTTYTELINLLALTQEMRRREKDFFLRKDVIYAKQYEKLLGEALAQLEHLKKLNTDKNAELSRLSELLTAHQKEFLFSVSLQETIGLDLDKGIQGKMRDYIHNLEDILVKIKNEKLTILLFTLRRNEKNFLLKMRTAPNHPTPEVASEFEAYLKKLPIRADLKERAFDSLNKYIKEFKTLVSKEGALQKSTAQLSSVFTQVEKIHFQLLNETKSTSQSSYDHLRSSIAVFQVVSLVLSLLVLLLSILCIIKSK